MQLVHLPGREVIMDALRIPPSVSFAFEQVVSKVCYEAKVDYDDRPFMSRELQHLESFWRRETEKGLSTDDAQEQALAAFGSVEDVARKLRQPLWRRLLLFESYRAERYIVFLCIGVIVGFFFSALLIWRTAPKRLDFVTFFKPIGYMLNPIYALIALFLVRWRPKIKNCILRYLALLRFIIAPIVVTGLLNVILTPIKGARFIIYEGIEFEFGSIICATWYIMLVPLGLVAAACYISELFGLPQRHKRAQAKLRTRL